MVKITTDHNDYSAIGLKNLEICFNSAKATGTNYVGVLIGMEGFEKPEIIINHLANFDKKLDYYKSAYNEDLKHKFAEGISIIGFTYGNTFAEIEADLIRI